MSKIKTVETNEEENYRTLLLFIPLSLTHTHTQIHKDIFINWDANNQQARSTMEIYIF